MRCYSVGAILIIADVLPHILGYTNCAAKAFFILPYNELAIAQGPKIQQKKEL